MENDDSVRKTLSHLPSRPPVNLEFQDLTYTVPQGRKGSKLILRSINGYFRSGQLCAILGPSGAGKSTLLNVLAGYKTIGATGTVTINGQPRNMKQFRKISRYIMQDDLLQPMLTVQESMLIAADLKLNRDLSKKDKLITVKEILEILRLTSAKDTLTTRLSGGERKRVSIALELLNNPPIIFLDEPTTGLDDLSCSQCISLLKLLTEGGRTVICSIHAPSARLFSKFDHAYIVSAGQCMYQGDGQNIIPFMTAIGLACPTYYNPADFIIEVSSGDYGMDFLEKMSTAIDSGRNTSYCKKPKCDFEEIQLGNQITTREVEKHMTPISAITYAPTTTPTKPVRPYKCDYSIWHQFKILLRRFWLQTYRDKNLLIFKIGIHIILGIIIGCFFLNMGKDASKTLFNFGFCYICVIAFLYLPLMPVLLQFPTEIQLVKREHFNQWYGLTAYYLAMTVTTLPIHAIMTILYTTIAYILSDQPLELQRLAMFLLICVLISFISESFGLMIASVLDIVNGMFVGPVISVPLMLLAVYGIGQAGDVPIIIKTAMYFSYLRYGMEGLTLAIYGNGRGMLPCPEEEDICPFRDPKLLVAFMGMGNFAFWVDLLALLVFFFAFRLTSFYLLRQRIRPNKTVAALQVIGRIVKSHFNVTR